MAGDLHIFDGKDIKTYIDNRIGASVGTVSHPVHDTGDISGTTAPTPTTIGTDIDVLSHPTGVDTGQLFDFLVPEDYDSGDMEIWAVFQMSGTDADAVKYTYQAKIVDQSGGGIDTSSYPATATTLTVPGTTNITASKLFEVASGDFAAGDVIQAYITRNGTTESPVNSNDWYVIQYYYVYTAQVASRSITVPAEVWDDYNAETAPADGTIGTDIPTLDFSPTVDNSQKAVFQVPGNWGGGSDGYFYIAYAMSTQESGKKCRFQVGGEIANATDGSVDTISVQEVTVYPANLSAGAPQDHQFLLAVSASAMHAGDRIEIYVRRKGSDGTGDTHNGNFQLIHGYMNFGVIPSSSYAAIVTDARYMEYAGVESVSGSPTFLMPVPQVDGSTGYESAWKMTGNGAADAARIWFSGRLNNDQTTITSIKIPIWGNGNTYQIKVFTDTNGTTAVYTTPGSPGAPNASLTEYEITGTNLSGNQPVTKKRFHISVDVVCDSTEYIYVGRPFVAAE